MLGSQMKEGDWRKGSQGRCRHDADLKLKDKPNHISRKIKFTRKWVDLFIYTAHTFSPVSGLSRPL